MAVYWVGWNLETVKKKLFAVSNSCWCHFTAHICGYISIIAYMDLTIASKKNVSRVTSRLDELKNIFFALRHIHHVYMRFLFHQTMSMFIPYCRQFNYLFRKNHL